MTRIAFHRGGTLEYGDSTPAGFFATSRMALEEVEFDVHPTRDGHIVVHHDPTLDRTTDRSGAIADLTLDEVRAATILDGAGGHPLLLEELCDIYAQSPVAFRCEVKSSADGTPYQDFVPQVIATQARHGRLESSRFSSFDIGTVGGFGQACDQPRLWLVNSTLLEREGIDHVISIARDHGLPEIVVHIDLATPTLMEQALDAGIAFGCWAAHSAEQFDKALDFGVKVFTSDRPTLAIARREIWLRPSNRFRHRPSQYPQKLSCGAAGPAWHRYGNPSRRVCCHRRPLRLRERNARAEEVARTLQLDPYLDRKPGALSGGQRQRVAMGRAMARNSLTFLMDEPLSNLDNALRVAMRREIKQLHRQLGATMIYVTHDQTEALSLADRVAVFKGGHLLQFDTPEAILHCDTAVGPLTLTVPRAAMPADPDRFWIRYRIEDALFFDAGTGDAVRLPRTARSLPEQQQVPA